jgi:pyruvate dehydrogenase E1 component alpha subunit
MSKTSQDPAKAAINKALTPEKKIDLYRQMVRIRRFEETAKEQYSKSKMGGFLHLYIGQESIAVGCASLMGPHDHMITAYRNHGHGLAVGMGMDECMAELFGKGPGCSKGKGGSMHYFDPSRNYWGGHGIVAGQTPLGLGLAYGVKYRSEKGCSMTFLGDGAVNQGAFHEALNLAELWDLPAIFIIENNGYSMGTSQVRSSAYSEYLAKRAEGYGMAWEQFDGTDVLNVRARVGHYVERAHKENKPALLEIATYRYLGHSVADANALKYRTKEEVERYQRDHDPLEVYKARLLAEGILTEAEAKKISREASAEAEASADFSDSAPYPEPETIFEDVYWEVDNKTEAGATGRHFFND